MKIYFEQNKLYIEHKAYQWIIPAIIFAVMFFAGLTVFFAVCFSTDLNVPNLIFISIWIIFISLVFIPLFAECYGHKIIIDYDGVYEKNFLKKEMIHFTWENINDWGVTYSGRGKGGRFYSLYFSPVVIPTKRNSMKQLRKRKNVIEFKFEENYYKQVIDIMVPYCKSKVTILPFISK